MDFNDPNWTLQADDPPMQRHTQRLCRRAIMSVLTHGVEILRLSTLTFAVVASGFTAGTIVLGSLLKDINIDIVVT